MCALILLAMVQEMFSQNVYLSIVIQNQSYIYKKKSPFICPFLRENMFICNCNIEYFLKMKLSVKQKYIVVEHTNDFLIPVVIMAYIRCNISVQIPSIWLDFY